MSSVVDDDRRARPASPVLAPALTHLPPQLLVPAAAAGLLALLFLVLAVVVAEPSRHAHGLLIVIDLVGVVGVGAVWLRVIRVLGLGVHRGPVE